MKKIIFLVISIILLLIIACKDINETNITKEDFIITCTIDGIKKYLYLKEPITDLEKEFGRPKKTKVIDEYNKMINYNYNNFNVDFFKDENEILVIRIHKSTCTTARGIHVGDTFEKLIDVYGKNYIKQTTYDKKTTIHYYSPVIYKGPHTCGITFTINTNNVIESILLDSSYGQP